MAQKKRSDAGHIVLSIKFFKIYPFLCCIATIQKLKILHYNQWRFQSSIIRSP